MHIVLATRIFAPEPGAAALRLAGLANELAKRGNRVTVLTSTFNGEPNKTNMGNLHTRRFPALRDKTGAVRGYIQYLSFDIPLFFRLLATDKPDVVVCEPPPTTGVITRIACATRRIPYVYYAGDILSDAAVAGGMGAVAKIIRIIERTALSGATNVIAVSDQVAARATALGASKTTVVPNGIATTIYHSNRARPPALPPSDGPVFLYGGTVASWLQPEIFIDAFAQVAASLPSSQLVFLGQGTAWEALIEYANHVGITALFHPAVSPTEALQWYAYADVALASLADGSYSYAYPTKILAALSQGTPVIYAGSGQAAVDIESADLGLVTAPNPAAVAEAMISLGIEAQKRTEADRHRLWSWVNNNRSLKVSSANAANAVLEVL
ncbi:MAG: glycosyltransferase family 4 protein [Trueperella sp.]|nr:glycosyltransferase family 4 protein [Trueperella sp.]